MGGCAGVRVTSRTYREDGLLLQRIFPILAHLPKRKELFGPLVVTNIRTFVDPKTRIGWR